MSFTYVEFDSRLVEFWMKSEKVANIPKACDLIVKGEERPPFFYRLIWSIEDNGEFIMQVNYPNGL